MGTTKIEALVEDMKDFMRANTHLVNSVDANGFIQSGRWTARFFWKKHDYCQSVDKTTRDAVERIVLETLPEIFPEKYSMLSSTEKIRWIELLEDMTKVLSHNPNEAKKNC